MFAQMHHPAIYPEVTYMEVLSREESWLYLRLLEIRANYLKLTSHPEIPGSSVTSSPCPNIGFTVI